MLITAISQLKFLKALLKVKIVLKIRQQSGLFFIAKLSKGQKLNSYYQWQQGYPIAYLVKPSYINDSNLYYLLRLLDYQFLPAPMNIY